MKECEWNTGDQLPAIMNAEDIANYLGISKAGAYELMKLDDFPSIRIGQKSLRVPSDRFLNWIDEQVDVSR